MWINQSITEKIIFKINAHLVDLYVKNVLKSILNVVLGVPGMQLTLTIPGRNLKIIYAEPIVLTIVLTSSSFLHNEISSN
uniref:Uncharacterized protein n=1 Tax=Romanomermis culicivorax TaxID=13658 RepID=A0A915I4T4_ROMCU